jgi:hypothetical protein
MNCIKALISMSNYPVLKLARHWSKPPMLATIFNKFPVIKFSKIGENSDIGLIIGGGKNPDSDIGGGKNPDGFFRVHGSVATAPRASGWRLAWAVTQASTGFSRQVQRQVTETVTVFESAWPVSAQRFRV